MQGEHSTPLSPEQAFPDAISRTRDENEDEEEGKLSTLNPQLSTS
jgi:hypothetical protein